MHRHMQCGALCPRLHAPLCHTFLFPLLLLTFSPQRDRRVSISICCISAEDMQW